jgi:hypothetical protein
MNQPPIIDRLLGPTQPELGCDECFEYLDRYVEAELGSRFELCPTCVTPADCTPANHCLGMQAHLQGCPACAEEHASLKALLQTSESNLHDPPDSTYPQA